MPPIETQIRPNSIAAILSSVAALGVVSSFISTVTAFTGLENAGKNAALIGADNELGYPSSAFALVLFAVVLAVGFAELAGARIASGWRLVLVTVLAIGTVFELWSVYLAVVGSALTAFLPAQLALMAALFTLSIVWMPRGRTDAGIGIFMTVAGVIGFFAALRLTIDKVGTFVDPATAPSCNFSILVQCGVNLKSWQGSLFGFPNPLLGVGGWTAVIMVGVMLLAGLRFARWFWIAFNIGVAGALVFVCWLIYQSIFVLATLCPWCMATWLVTIPTFWLITLYNLKNGHIPVPRRARGFFTAAYGWVPLLTFASYVVIFMVAQLRLDVLNHL